MSNRPWYFKTFWLLASGEILLLCFGIDTEDEKLNRTALIAQSSSSSPYVALFFAFRSLGLDFPSGVLGVLGLVVEVVVLVLVLEVGVLVGLLLRLARRRPQRRDLVLLVDLLLVLRLLLRLLLCLPRVPEALLYLPDIK